MTDPEPISDEEIEELKDDIEAGVNVVGANARETLSIITRLRAAEAFKKWVHEYLDGKGIPHHPPGVHGAEGCRIGDRMDYVFEKVALSERRRKVLIKLEYYNGVCPVCGTFWELGNATHEPGCELAAALEENPAQDAGRKI